MRKVLKLLACIVMPCATAGPVMTHSDPYIVLYRDYQVWTTVKHYQPGLARVNIFQDQGKEGVKQVNLIVNCTNRTMALQGFQVSVGYDTDSFGYLAPDNQPLTFYKPVTSQDLTIASAVCMTPIAPGVKTP